MFLLLCNIDFTVLWLILIRIDNSTDVHNFIGQFLPVSNARGFQMPVFDWCVLMSRVPYEGAIGVGSVGVCWLLCWCAVVRR